MKIKELKIVRPDVKNQGVPRSKMPQIATEDYPEFLDYLKEKGGDISKKTMSAKDLKPIQKEFSDKGVIKAIEKGKIEKPVISSNDGYIIDGHHRWLAGYNLGKDVIVYEVNMPVSELMKVVKEFPKTTYKDMYERGIPAYETMPAYNLKQAEKNGQKFFVDKNKPNTDFGIYEDYAMFYHINEMGVKQSNAMKVLHQLDMRKDNTPFPVRLRDEDGPEVIQVKPDTAKKLLRLYYKTTKDNQAKFTNMVDTFDGFKKLVKMVENQDQKKNLKNQK